MTTAQRRIERFGEANISTSQLMSVLEIETGGTEYIGCCRKDRICHGCNLRGVGHGKRTCPAIVEHR